MTEFQSIDEEVIYHKLMNRPIEKTTDARLEESVSAPPVGTVQTRQIDQGKINAYFDEITSRIATLESTRVNYPYYEMPKQPFWKPLKKIKYILKKGIKKSVEWCLNAAYDRQTEFNSAIVPCVGRLTELESLLFNLLLNEVGPMAVSANQQVSALEQGLSEMRAAFSALDQKYADSEASKEWEARGAEIEKRLKKLELTTRLLKANSATVQQLSALEKESASGKTVSALEQRLTVSEKTVSYLELISAKAEQLAALGHRLDAAEQAAVQMRGELDVSARLGAMETRLDAAEQAAVQMRGELDASPRLGAVESRMNAAEQAAAQRLTALEEKFSQIESWYTTHMRQMKSLDQKIKVMEEQGILQQVELIERKDEQDNLSKKSLSQSGEDIILSYVIKNMGVQEKDCTYLDLGANHAKQYSNTYYFYNKGAKGVLVEANPALIPELRLLRSEDVVVNCCIDSVPGKDVDFYILNGDGLSTPDKSQVDEVIKRNPYLKVDRVVSVKTMTVNEIIEKYFDRAPVYMNIDLEGDDLRILSSIDWEKHRPLVVTIEMIPYRPHLVVNEKNEEILAFMESVDYVEYAFTGINSIFLDKRQLKDVLS